MPNVVNEGVVGHTLAKSVQVKHIDAEKLHCCIFARPPADPRRAPGGPPAGV